jgi:hypothetical protein
MTAVQTPRKPFPLARAAGIAGGVVVLIVIAAAIVLKRNWPFTEEKVASLMEQRTERQVLIGHFTTSYFPPGCTVENIRFLHHKDKQKPPIMTVQKLLIRTTWAQLISRQKRLDLVEAQGVHVMVPPRTPNAQGKVGSVMPLTAKNGTAMVIANIRADGAVLEFRRADKDKEPFVVTMHRLSLLGVGDQGPLRYDGAFRISEPPGEIATKGQFGPWVSDQPGLTPVTGTYTFRDADLGAFHKLNGTISSDGRFSGTLEHINATGSTDLPNFRITGKGHTIHLSATYDAEVDGRNGDTVLKRIDLNMGHSTIRAHGSVEKYKAGQGKNTHIEGTLNGRIEDAMLPFMVGPRSPMTGKLLLNAKMELPPGPGTFIHKIRGDGDFGVNYGKFTSKAAQKSIDRLAKSAQGARNRDQEDQDPMSVVENLRGHVSLANGVATFTNVTFHAPDSTAQAHGTINLATHQMDLHGILRTQGRVSDETTGFKSFMLKTMTPFLKKKNNVTQIGFKITGDTSSPAVGLDLNAKPH